MDTLYFVLFSPFYYYGAAAIEDFLYKYEESIENVKKISQIKKNERKKNGKVPNKTRCITPFTQYILYG